MDGSMELKKVVVKDVKLVDVTASMRVTIWVVVRAD